MYKLMIVDDSKLIRQKIERECDNNLFKVVATATNGAEAIVLFKESNPDVVTMDITMPKLDGIECIQGLVKINANAKILVVSALNDKATGLTALEEGAMGFLTKPFSGQSLQEALREMIED